MISHHTVIAQCIQVQQLALEEPTKALAVLPCFHITGLVHLLHLPIIRNTPVYMLPAFNMQSMLQTVVECQIPELLLVPPIILRLLHDPVVKNYNLTHMRRFSSGAAPLSAEVLQQLSQQFPWTAFKQGYGMTESTSCISAHPPDKDSYDYASRAGVIISNTEVKIMHTDTNEELGVGEEGESLVRGPQVATMGYLRNEAATKETFDEEGWLHTGDVGFVDQEAFIV